MSQYIALHNQVVLDFPENKRQCLKDFYLKQDKRGYRQA